MRATLGAALGLLVVGGTLLTGRPLDVQAIGGLNTVTVSPGHGRSASSFQVTYAVSPCVNAVGLNIGFSWGALAPAGPVLGAATTDSACRATLTATPPAKPAPGTYQVFGYVALPTGAPAPNTEASAAYTVDVTPAPTTTASSSATARPTASSQPSASAPGGTGASPAASAPSASDQPRTDATPQITAGNVTASHPGPQPLWWNPEWTVGRRALVIALSILILLAFLAAWFFRWRRTRVASAAGRKDKAA